MSYDFDIKDMDYSCVVSIVGSTHEVRRALVDKILAMADGKSRVYHYVHTNPSDDRLQSIIQMQAMYVKRPMVALVYHGLADVDISSESFRYVVSKCSDYAFCVIVCVDSLRDLDPLVRKHTNYAFVFRSELTEQETENVRYAFFGRLMADDFATKFAELATDTQCIVADHTERARYSFRIGTLGV